jgi:CheY-like chemotaxis protein
MPAIRILFVEDSSSDVILAQRELRKVGLDPEVRTVEDERALRHALATWDPDLIVSDSMIPGFDGFRAFELSRQLASEVPFIFRTGRARDNRSLRALQHGACGWVNKDNGDAFAALVMNALYAHEMIRFEWVSKRHRPIEDALRVQSLKKAAVNG